VDYGGRDYGSFRFSNLDRVIFVVSLSFPPLGKPAVLFTLVDRTTTKSAANGC